MSDRQPFRAALAMSAGWGKTASVLASTALWRLVVAGLLCATLWLGVWWALHV